VTGIPLPALRSDDPLGFLAALGIVEVLRSEGGVPDGDLALGWDGVGGPAELRSPFESVESLVEALHSAAERMHADGRLVPARLPEAIPPTLSDKERADLKRQTGTEQPFDSVRMPRTQSVARFCRLGGGASDADARWMCGLVDQCSTFPGETTAHVTPLYAPTGRQRMRQIYEARLAAVVARSGLLLEACTMWRRNPGDRGANLDRRARRDGSVTTDGRPRNAAVTGAEWLALQAVPWFRLGGLRNRPTAWGWVPTGPRSRPRALLWPVWRNPLDPVALEVMLTHPLVRRAGSGGRVRAAELRALGVLAVLRADRAVLANSDGPLGPARVVWPDGA
jgi:hypothetical protein